MTEKVKSEKAANDPKGLLVYWTFSLTTVSNNTSICPYSAATVTAACKSEIREFKIAMYRDISLDVKMGNFSTSMILTECGP